MRVMPRLRSRDRRALLAGLLIVAPVVVYRFGVTPWYRHLSAAHATLVTERALLARERAIVSQAHDMSRRLDAVRSQVEAARPWLVAGGSDADVSSELSRDLTGWARRDSILIQEVQAGSAESHDQPIDATSLSVQALGDLEGIATFLHDIETGPPMLRVDELEMRAAGMNDGDLDRGQLMSVRIAVTGYWLRADQPTPHPPRSIAGTP